MSFNSTPFPAAAAAANQTSDGFSPFRISVNGTIPGATAINDSIPISTGGLNSTTLGTFSPHRISVNGSVAGSNTTTSTSQEGAGGKKLEPVQSLDQRHDACANTEHNCNRREEWRGGG